MNAIRIHLNGRSAIALLLAVVMMTLAAAPALAREPEGASRVQARHMVVSGAAKNFSSSHVTRLASPTNQSLKLRPSLARAQ